MVVGACLLTAKMAVADGGSALISSSSRRSRRLSARRACSQIMLKVLVSHRAPPTQLFNMDLSTAVAEEPLEIWSVKLFDSIELDREIHASTASYLEDVINQHEDDVRQLEEASIRHRIEEQEAAVTDYDAAMEAEVEALARFIDEANEAADKDEERWERMYPTFARYIRDGSREAIIFLSSKEESPDGVQVRIKFLPKLPQTVESHIKSKYSSIRPDELTKFKKHWEARIMQVYADLMREALKKDKFEHLDLDKATWGDLMEDTFQRHSGIIGDVQIPAVYFRLMEAGIALSINSVFEDVKKKVIDITNACLKKSPESLYDLFDDVAASMNWRSGFRKGQLKVLVESKWRSWVLGHCRRLIGLYFQDDHSGTPPGWVPNITDCRHFVIEQLQRELKLDEEDLEDDEQIVKGIISYALKKNDEYKHRKKQRQEALRKIELKDRINQAIGRAIPKTTFSLLAVFEDEHEQKDFFETICLLVAADLRPAHRPVWRKRTMRLLNTEARQIVVTCLNERGTEGFFPASWARSE